MLNLSGGLVNLPAFLSSETLFLFAVAIGAEQVTISVHIQNAMHIPIIRKT